MPRVAALWLVASALLLFPNPGQAQVQQQQQMKQQQLPPMQMPLETKRSLQLPGTLVVEKAGAAAGAIQSVGGQEIDCGSRCEYRYQPGSPSQIRLKVTMALGSWAEWSGACTGTHPECLVPMSADARQRVVVAIHYPRVTVRLHGRGVITGPNSFVCSGTNIECHQEYAGTFNPQHIGPQNLARLPAARRHPHSRPGMGRALVELQQRCKSTTPALHRHRDRHQGGRGDVPRAGQYLEKRRRRRPSDCDSGAVVLLQRTTAAGDLVRVLLARHARDANGER